MRQWLDQFWREQLGDGHASLAQGRLLRHDLYGEKLIAVGQAAICCFVLSLHMAAQIANSLYAFNIWVVSTLLALIASSVLRYWLASGPRLRTLRLALLTCTDMAVFMLLIWSYQYAYNQPAAAVLKAPSFTLLFALIALRALRFHPRPIIVAGVSAIAGWSLLVLAAVLTDGTGAITRDYAHFIESHSILLGAEIEKMVAVAALTAFLAAAVSMARRHLDRAIRARETAETARSELALRERELEVRTTRFKKALDNMPHGLCMFDKDENLVVANDRFKELFDLADAEVLPGTNHRQVVEQCFKAELAADPAFSAKIDAVLDVPRKRKAWSKLQPFANGRLVLVSCRPLPDGGFLTTHEDMSELHKVREEIAHLSQHDQLTGLPNRAALNQRISATFAVGGSSFALLSLDIDRFSTVNETLGHASGDMLLKAVAARLQDSIGERDTLTRIGSDEFVVVHPLTGTPTEAATLAQHICDSIQKPFSLNGQQALVSASIGIAVAGSDARDTEELLKKADIALTRAKAMGKGGYLFFEEGMDARMKQRRELELAMRAALNDGEMELYYQPLWIAKTQALCGFEALMRWHRPGHGPVSPTEFIPIAEETGLILPLGEWSLRTACAQAARWPGDIKIAVNLSPVQFASGDLEAIVMNALATSGLAPQRLELEITESVVLHDSETTRAILARLRALGVRIALDDFGTGYSSLSYLRSFPFDKIKADRSFISDATSCGESNAIARAVAGLGTSLGVRTTAEGVETAEQLALACKLGYTEIQGYYLSPPLPAAQADKLVAGSRQRKQAKAG